MSAKIYRPRCFVVLTVPVLGTAAQRANQAQSSEAINLPIHPTAVRLISNYHNEADTCSITADWRQAGCDPRMLDDAVVQVHLDDADDFGHWEPTRENCRFIGLLKENSAERQVGKAGVVTLDAVDYTDLFLRAKPFGSDGIPRFDQTLADAWRTIVEQTPGAAILADKLVFEGDAAAIASKTLGSAVAARFAKIGKVQTEPETDAWAVWQQCVGMLALISFIRRDQCVVTTATNYYTEKNPPKLAWGKNLTSWSETRNADVAGTGIVLTSFDAINQKTIEACWPPIGDESVKKKRGAAKNVNGEGGMLSREKREYYPYPGVSDPDQLQKIAKNVYEQRSRQELTGKCSTAEMRVDRMRGPEFDLLSLHSGDSVSVQVEPENQQLLAALEPGQRVPFLVKRGYTEEVATLMIANMEEFAALGSSFLVRSAETELTLDEDGGTFSIDISYINRIVVSGATDG